MLKEMTIEHFRGFYEPKTISFAQPTGVYGSGLTVLVGPNNSGKTTVIDALRLLTRDTAPIEIEHRHEGKQVRLSVTSTSDQIKVLTNPDLGATTVVEGDVKALEVGNLRYVPSRRGWSAFTGHTRMEEGGYWHNLSGYRQPTDEFLVARLAAFSLDEKSMYHRSLAKLIPQISDWRIDLSRGQLFIQYTTQTGAKHSADLFGDGMASLFRITLAVHDARVREGQAEQCIAIDEPELSLHPPAQKRLARYLAEIACNRQVIVTTHSPYFIDWDDLIAGARIYRLAYRNIGIDARALAAETIESVGTFFNDWQKPNLLDPVAREIFFADSAVFFEGQEDIGLLRKFARERKIEPLEIFGYGVGGAGNLKLFLRMASELGLRTCAIYDGDKKAEMEEAAKLFPDFMIECLVEADIRDKMKRDVGNRETNIVDKAGIFDRAGNIKPEYEKYLVNLMARIRVYLSGA